MSDLLTSINRCMCMLLQVRAIDGGSPPRYSDHSLTINILDINDNAPVIESLKGYNVSISEVGMHYHILIFMLSTHDLQVSIVLYVSKVM